MENLIRKLEADDMGWIVDFEVAVVRAAFEYGLLEEMKRTESVPELATITKIDERVLAAVVPVIKNAPAFDGEPARAKTGSRTRRFLTLFRNGNTHLMGTVKSFSEMWETGDVDAESARKFSRSMYEDSLLPAKVHMAAQPFREIKTLVDLGGGGGAWAEQSTLEQPNLNYVVFDLPSVCAATKDIIRDSRTIRFHEGNFFKDPIPAADGYLLSNILHDWSFANCSKILVHLFEFMPSGSTLLINECLLNASKTGPRFTSIFNLLMLLNHSSQQFTFAELSNLLEQTGFETPLIVSNAAHYALLSARKL